MQRALRLAPPEVQAVYRDARSDEHRRVLDTIVDWRSDKFTALATAFQNCGAFVLTRSQTPPGNSIEPGAMQFTRMFLRASVAACDIV